MWLLLLEAGVAGFLFIFIIWWTMYANPKAPRPPPKMLPPQDEHSE